jgi:hypothetical protein
VRVALYLIAALLVVLIVPWLRRAITAIFTTVVVLLGTVGGIALLIGIPGLH